MTALDSLSARINKGSSKALQSMAANSPWISGSSVRVTIIISKVVNDETQVLEQVDTGSASPAGEGSSGFRGNSINVTHDFREGWLLGATQRAWADAAAHLRDPDIVATGTLQVEEFDGGYYNYSFEVPEKDNVLHLERLVGPAR